MYVAYLTDSEGHASDGVHTFAIGSTAVEATERLRQKFLAGYSCGGEGEAEGEWADIINGEHDHVYLFTETDE